MGPSQTSRDDPLAAACMHELALKPADEVMTGKSKGMVARLWLPLLLSTVVDAEAALTVEVPPTSAWTSCFFRDVVLVGRSDAVTAGETTAEPVPAQISLAIEDVRALQRGGEVSVRVRTPACEGAMADTRTAPGGRSRAPAPAPTPSLSPPTGSWTRVLWAPGTEDTSKTGTGAIDRGGRAVVPLTRHFPVPRCGVASALAATPTATGRFEVCFRFRPGANMTANAHTGTAGNGSADLHLEPGTAHGTEAAASHTGSGAEIRTHPARSGHTDRPAPALVRFSFSVVRVGSDSGSESAEARRQAGGKSGTQFEADEAVETKAHRLVELVEQLEQQVQALREQQASGRKREAHKLEAAETNLVRARWLGAAKLAAVVLVIAAQITMTRQQGASNSPRDIDSSKSPGKTQRSGQN